MPKKLSAKKPDKDDVLSLFDSSSEEAEFSGFERDDSNIPSKGPPTPKLKSVVSKVKHRESPNKVSGENSTSGRHVVEKIQTNLVDLDNLNQVNIAKIKSALGLGEVLVEKRSRAQIEPSEQDEWDQGPIDLGAQHDNIFGSDEEHSGPLDPYNEEDEEVWQMPKLKTPDKGDPINESMANMINAACTKQCQINEIIEKYKIPSNCEFMGAPEINEELKGDLSKMKRTNSTDKALKDIQDMITSGMLPLVGLANVLRSKSPDVGKARELIRDSLTLIGQVQFQMSVRRRYMLRPSLKSKYYKMCSINTPITTQLFGDDIAKELKKCETRLTVGNFVPFYNKYNRGQSGFGPYRGGRGRGPRGRGNPYSRPPMYDRGYGQFGHQHTFPQRRGKRATATVTSEGPN